MSNRNYDSSSVIKILKSQNTANFYNRQITIASNISTIPAQRQIQPANPLTANYDADLIGTIHAGQQAYYLKGLPIVTVLSPQIYDTSGGRY